MAAAIEHDKPIVDQRGVSVRNKCVRNDGDAEPLSLDTVSRLIWDHIINYPRQREKHARRMETEQLANKRSFCLFGTRARGAVCNHRSGFRGLARGQGSRPSQWMFLWWIASRCDIDTCLVVDVARRHT